MDLTRRLSRHHSAKATPNERISVLRVPRRRPPAECHGSGPAASDVNPGAQLIAGGDIIVWGKLQGSAHAGALGDTRAIICALDMSPSLVKIADAALALRPGELKKRNKTGKAEQAQLTDQQITFTPWDKNA